MNKKNICSFCTKNNLQVEKLISGTNASICNECLYLAIEAIQKDKENSLITDGLLDITLKKLKEEFDKHVIGQEEAKKYLSVVVSNHYKKLLHQNEESLQDNKVNLLMIGPSSSGKTLLLRVLQKFLAQKGIPIAFADATTLTEAGYVGDDVESMLLRLLQEADYNVQKAEKGIVFIDEIDKIAQRNVSGFTKDISGQGVQHALLGILQGKIASVTIGKKGISQETITIDTSNILFICAGAFSGLEKIIQNRTNTTKIGFHSTINKNITTKNYKKFEVDDLLEFGFIPEFIGRFSSIVSLDPLTKEQLIDVLTKTENSLIKQYEKLVQFYGSTLSFEPKAIEKIAEIALTKQTTTRGLKTIIESILTETLFEIEDKHCHILITEDNVVQRNTTILPKISEKKVKTTKKINKIT